MVDNLTDEHRESKGQRWAGNRFTYEAMLAAFRFVLEDRMVCLRIEGAPDFRAEVLDILVGPFNLRPTAIKPVRHARLALGLLGSDLSDIH
jgi:hypothetical protein